MIGILLGALSTLVGLSYSARAERAELDRELEPIPQCTIAIVIVGIDDSLVSTTIDAKTGRGGFSHVYLDPCRFTPDGLRAIIDYVPGRGVHWADAERYRDRPRARIELRGVLGHEVLGCVRAKLGTPFRLAPMLAGRDDSGHCTGLIVHCLPPAVRRAIRDDGRCVSPNDLADFFKVKSGETVVVDDDSLSNDLRRRLGVAA